MKDEQNDRIKIHTVNLLKGIAIGIANIIPGVSGGTMALILGIYERLITAIKNISIKTVFAFIGVLKFKRKNWEDFKTEMRRIDAAFLITLAFGTGIAILALANLMTYLLENWHDPTYGFFFGLVAVSIFVPFKLIKERTLGVLITTLIGIALVIGLSQSMSGESLIEKAEKKQELKLQQVDSQSEEKSYQTELTIGYAIYLFIVGNMSVSAMILPGISGSFLLLLFGVYFDILKAITYRHISLLLIFLLGCGVGVLIITRLVNFLLRRWHDFTMGFLLGLVIGSLWAIWPFKTSVKIGSTVIYLSNRIPISLGNNELLALLSVIVGASVVLIFIWLEKRMKRLES